ncbi:hypothetical protein KUL118_60720 [Tenacibaculum sp. KUL118]|uniref:Uncharacterized protein n=1 Tax=Tenacibaculum sp. Pbs-1 TaxID=3238748 RepID=A0AB33KZ56_9FLAO|nr:hypothetical protein BACY1_22830 [Tenacibaculum mesophilum]GFD75984.1 hypothetical protein KUL113_54040 [Tenacibaculum sp. KUL113]GFD83210.1 hypothetical protein KUL118_60720 [Tenacibaculum sp. KUL118]
MSFGDVIVLPCIVIAVKSVAIVNKYFIVLVLQYKDATEQRRKIYRIKARGIKIKD